MYLTRHQTTSITRELDNCDSPLRRLLRPHQDLLDRWRQMAIAAASDLPWTLPARTQLAWMAAMAIDYRVRWWLSGVDALPEPVLAGLCRCRPHTVQQLGDAFADVRGVAAGPQGPSVERRLATVAVAAASVEPLFRAGAVPCRLDELGLATFTDNHRDVIDDVISMASALPELLTSRLGLRVMCGPVTATGRLSGDADLVVGDELIEIKAVVDPRRSMTRAAQQLLVYAARLQPMSAALLLPRQHALVEFDLTGHADTLRALDQQIRSAYER
jgi:hypothetical protein